MSLTQMLLLFVLPAAVAAGTFTLPYVRRWLEVRAAEAEAQLQLVEEYQDEAARFLRSTDPERDAKLRHMVVWTGHQMMQGTSLIRGIIFAKGRMDNGDAPSREEIDEFEAMPVEVRHQFAKRGAIALLVSSYRSMFFGKRLRSILVLMLSPETREVSEPVQLVHRYNSNFAAARQIVADCTR